MESVGIVYMDLDVPGQCDTVFCVLGTHEDDKHADVTGHTWTTIDAPHLTPEKSRQLCLMCDAHMPGMAVIVFTYVRAITRVRDMTPTELRLCIDCGRDGNTLTRSTAHQLVEAQRRRLARRS